MLILSVMEGAASPSAAGNGKRKELEDFASALMEDAAGAAGTHKRLKRQLTQESDLKVEIQGTVLYSTVLSTALAVDVGIEVLKNCEEKRW